MDIFLTSIALFVATLLFIQVGFVLGKRAITAGVTKSDFSMNAIEAFAFSILGLILAFSFSYASGRLDARRELVVNEANAVGTAFLRLDLLDEPDRSKLKEQFVNYMDARIEFNQALGSGMDIEDALRKTSDAKDKIWSRIIPATEKENPSMRVVILPPINEMFDLADSRRVASETKTPGLVIGLMVVLSLLCATLAGRTIAMHGWHHWTHRIIFASVIAVTFFTILDLNDPRTGIVRLDYADKLLIEARAQAQAQLGAAH